MIYQEFPPDMLLVPYIETYWTAHGVQGAEEFHQVLPDGCVDIIIPLNLSAPIGMNPFRPTIIGAMTTFYNGSYPGDVSLFGIRFRPAGFTAFCRMPISEFTDKKIDLTLVESLFDKRFYEDWAEKETLDVLIRYVNSYFIHKLGDVFTIEPQIIYAINLIRQSNGQLRPGDIAGKCCLSVRHLERKFKMAVGISPKLFSRIVKFQYTRNYLETNNCSNLLDAAVDCGYYDHAHLIKDFKMLSGNVPSDFKR